MWIKYVNQRLIHGHFGALSTGTLGHNPLVISVSFSVSWSQPSVDNLSDCLVAVGATVLGAVKGWVLAVLAVLALRAARGCGRLRSRCQAAPPLTSAARRGELEVSGRRASRHNDA